MNNLNIRAQPRPKRKVIQCPIHKVDMYGYDDMISMCPIPPCDQISMNPKLRGIADWQWYYCDECHWNYITLEDGICTICDDSMRLRIQEILDDIKV